MAPRSSTASSPEKKALKRPASEDGAQVQAAPLEAKKPRALERAEDEEESLKETTASSMDLAREELSSEQGPEQDSDAGPEEPLTAGAELSPASSPKAASQLVVLPSRPATQQPPAPKALDFRCKFIQTVAFKSFFENLGNILSEATLEVRSSPEFSGLITDSLTSDMVCLVQGKIAGQVDQLNVPVEQAIFCITVKDVLDIFHNIHPQHFVEIYREKGSTDIVMHIYEPSLRAANFKYCIQTLDRDVDTLPLDEMTYSYFVEVELNAFKNALKTAKNQSVDSVQLLIYERASSWPAGAGERSIYFVIKFKGVRTSVSFPFESKILSDASAKGPVHIKAVDKDASGPEDHACDCGMLLHDLLETMQPVFQESFKLTNLFNFVKSMERTVITLRLLQNRPLIIDYPLGCSSTDHIRFVTSGVLSGTD